MITGRHLREARTLLGLQRSRLAAKVGTVTTLTIVRAEEEVDSEPPISPTHAAAIRQALESAGIEIGLHGVQLRKVVL